MASPTNPDRSVEVLVVLRRPPPAGCTIVYGRVRVMCEPRYVAAIERIADLEARQLCRDLRDAWPDTEWETAQYQASVVVDEGAVDQDGVPAVIHRSVMRTDEAIIDNAVKMALNRYVTKEIQRGAA